MLLYVDEGVRLLSGGFSGVGEGHRGFSASSPPPPPTREVKFSVYLHISKASAKDWWLFI